MHTTPPLTFGTIGLLMAYNIHWLLYLIPIIAVCDLFGRHRDYLNIRKMLASYNTDSVSFVQRAVLMMYRRSYCSRWACICAFCSLGIGDVAIEFYKKKGYRWYHIFPDYTFTRHSPFLKLSFYVILFTGR